MVDNKYFKILRKHDNQLFGVEHNPEILVKDRVYCLNQTNSRELCYEEIGKPEYIELANLVQQNNKMFLGK